MLNGTIVTTPVSSLTLMEVALDHLLEPALEKLSEMTQTTICQVFHVSFKDPRTYYSQSYLSSTRVSFWRKVWLLISWSATLVSSTASTS
jgi:hypothetical protein